MKNVLLIIVDCLRYDRVTSQYMPWLTQFAAKHTFFTNYWGTSHCTDPCITHMLSGKHPDELKLYSMFFEHKDYSIPDSVEMLAQTAVKNGFTTGSVTNIGRWYERGVQYFRDCRRWPGEKIFNEAINMTRILREPWFVTCHTDDLHTNYTGGSYDVAARYTDGYIKGLIESVDLTTTVVIVTSDHGEGLGEKGIVQHGMGLWDFLTHVPLITTGKHSPEKAGSLMDHGSLYAAMRTIIDKDYVPKEKIFFKDFVFQCGDTPPKTRHRGVVAPNKEQLIVHLENDEEVDICYIGETYGEHRLIEELNKHCAKHGIVNNKMDKEVEERLRGLGYFG